MPGRVWGLTRWLTTRQKPATCPSRSGPMGIHPQGFPEVVVRHVSIITSIRWAYAPEPSRGRAVPRSRIACLWASLGSGYLPPYCPDANGLLHRCSQRAVVASEGPQTQRCRARFCITRVPSFQNLTSSCDKGSAPRWVSLARRIGQKLWFSDVNSQSQSPT